MAKSGSKSGVFKPGPDPRRGKGPPKGQGGRPPDRIRALFEDLATNEAHHGTLRRILRGEGTQLIETKKDADGTTIRILAVDVASYLRAHQYVTERVGGKPAQSVDLTSGGEPLPQRATLFGGLEIEF